MKSPDLVVLEELSRLAPDALDARVRELRAAGHDVSVFICGRERPTCYRCKSPAIKRCNAPGIEPGDICGKPLCGDHARGTKCSEHAPEQVSATMPKPPGRR